MNTGILSSAMLGHTPDTPTASAKPGSLTEVYEAELDYVFRALKGLGVASASIDDAVQDVFIVVQQKLDQFDGRCRLRTWLYAITLRVARRYREQAARSSRRHIQDEQVALQSRTVDRPEQQQQLWLAQQALSALSPEKREVFVLSQVEQLSAPEIAELTHLPLNTIYSRLRAAKAAFRAEVHRIERRSPRRQP